MLSSACVATLYLHVAVPEALEEYDSDLTDTINQKRNEISIQNENR